MSRPDLAELFAVLEELGAEPVVLRSYDGLPEEIDDDVDLLIRPAAMKGVGHALGGRGFRRRRDRVRCMTGATPHVRFDHRSGLRLDTVERFCYRSPYDPRHPWVAVDPRLTGWAFERRRRHPSGAFFVLAPQDHFAHVLGHCTFDKRRFEPYYRAVLSDLAATLDEAELEPVLAALYFKVWRDVLALVRAGEWERLTDLRWMGGY